MDNRLYRSTTEKYIGGVCGGLGEYFGIDPAFIRILFVLLIFANGIGLLAYLIFWIAIRKRTFALQTVTAPASAEPVLSSARSSVWNRYLPGLLLVIIGAILLIHQHWYWFDIEWIFDQYWPLLLIALGVLLLVYHPRSNRSGHDSGLVRPIQHQNGEATL